MPRKSRRSTSGRNTAKSAPIALRIIGGKHRGRKLKYSGDPFGPAHERFVFARRYLTSWAPAVRDTYAIDLFGGTGALALEAMSRGSVGAHIIERHLPTAKVIRENIETLGLQSEVVLVPNKRFYVVDEAPKLPECRWTVFFSPPYRLFVEKRDEMLRMVEQLASRAPSGSLLAVEATDEFDSLRCQTLRNGMSASIRLRLSEFTFAHDSRN